MKKINLFSLLFVIWMLGFSQENKLFSQPGNYHFENIKRLEATSVKNQGRTGTCWSFGTISFLESELLRMGKGPHDLSEMFVVRQSYIDHADLYVKLKTTSIMVNKESIPRDIRNKLDL